MYQRIGAAAYKADLKNTLALCEILKHPETKFKSIHVAGTNGKGSTSHMLAAILQKAGYKTGLYTSPHLKDFRERIKINGEMIPDTELVSFVENHKSQFEKIDLSFFEWTVGLCFDYFAREKVDIAVIETGLGGRLDSTNVITPEICVITNISFDHTNLLGNTLEKIATEKAGIIKRGVPTVIGEINESIDHVFIHRAEELKSPIVFASQKFNANVIRENAAFNVIAVEDNSSSIQHYEVDLKGSYQSKNIIAVLETVRLLQIKGWKINDEHISGGLKNVKQLTGLLGRWQRISDNPLTICDVGHNESGVFEVVNQLSKIPFRHLHFVLGMVNDKEVASVLKLLPSDATYYFCKAGIPRALDANDLKDKAKEFDLTGESYPSVAAALNAAQSSAEENDLVFVGGSTFVVAEVV